MSVKIFNNLEIYKIAKKFRDAEIVWSVTADESFANKIFIVMVMEVI